jgi:tripartite ATP-independent transporter DctM subunit
MSPVAILFLTFFGLVALRVPIAHSLALSSALVIWLVGLSFDLIAQQMFHGLNSFTLLAVPFFLLAGQLLNAGMITDRLVRLGYALVGWVRGGLAHINVVVSMIFAGMSGSSTADTAGVGAVMIPAMVKRGFDRRFTVAVTAASSTMGVIIPPSIMMVIYGAAGGVSIGGLFLAGAIPGLIIGLTQMAYCYYYAVKHDIPAEQRASLVELGAALKGGFLPLMVPVIIIGGVLTGKFTATEAGMIACVYTLVLIFGVFRSANWRAMPKVLADAVTIYSQPLLAVSAAMVFGWLLAYFDGPAQIAELSGPIAKDPTLTLLFILLLFIVLGTFMDAIPAIIIFMPIVEELVKSSGVNEIHAGLVVVMTLALGLITPPYGLCLLLACVIGGIRVADVMGQMVVFYALFLAVVLMIIFVPEIALFLPRLVMPQFVN